MTEYVKNDKPAVDPARVTMNSNGFAWREFMARLPADTVADDLKEPDLWRKVQTGPNALRRHDRICVVSFDETWVAEAIVSDADRTKAVLCKPRITNFPPRFDQLFQDEIYKVLWNGHGYVVVRKADSHVMTQPVASPAHAERELINLYPRPGK